MNKKRLLLIILVLTIVGVCFIIMLSLNKKYNKMIVSDNEWNNIISNRIMSADIKLENIRFNDYNLLIDNNNSVIYYSVVNNRSKNNPSVKYIGNRKSLKISFNKEISDEYRDNDNIYKVVLYDDNSYHIYSLVITNYPILNVNYLDNNKRRMDIDLELFDNHIDSPMRVLKSKGKLRVIEDGKEYSFSLMKESLGHNKRENHISIFGMDKQDEYVIKLADSIIDRKKYVRFFINREYVGIFSLEFEEGVMTSGTKK